MVQGLKQVYLCLLAVCVISVPAMSSSVDVQVLQNTQDRIVLEYHIDGFVQEAVSIDGEKYVTLKLAKEGLYMEAGSPALPKVNRSIVIPDDKEMEIHVLSAKYEEYPGIKVSPSKGNLLRTVDPATVPYSFGNAYAKDEFYPGAIASLGDPYIQRDMRGAVVNIAPLQYDPVSQVLRHYYSIQVEIVPVGEGKVNVLENRGLRSISRSFDQMYRHHFLNYSTSGLRYDPMDEEGDMLIICHDAWLSNIQPLVDHKNSRGIATTAVGVSTIGNNTTAIKNYIQNLYNTSNLAFVLLVGDSAQVATPTASGGSSDPSYAKLAGSDDYPEILVGRFSAESAADVDTQVARTINHETMPAPLQDWFMRATGVASNEGPGHNGEYDNEHMGYIRDDLLAYGYTQVDEIYQPTGNATAISNALNAGRGLVNYCGHGSETSWYIPNYTNSDVNALQNTGMLPVIYSVACVNGYFANYTCFAEAWMRATYNGEPSGAAAVYMSSINQSWRPPMDAQDEFNDLLVSEAYITFGALCYASSCKTMDMNGSDGVEIYDTWHIFGDPSLMMRVTCTDAGVLALDSAKYACSSLVTINLTDCGLNLDDTQIDTATVTIASDSDPEGMTVSLTEVGAAMAQFTASVEIDTSASPFNLLVSEGDTITVTYEDSDDGTGASATVVQTALVDCVSPVISNVHMVATEPRAATVGFDASEASLGSVDWGTSCDSLINKVGGSGYSTSPTVTITGLQDESTYYYVVEAEDEAGNVSLDDNGGACYSFTTPDIPDFYTEIFDETAGDNDIDNIMITFTPNGTYEYYDACVEPITGFPVDPAGGTTISMDDDDTHLVNPTIPVHLYGVDYSSFRIVSNGFLSLDPDEDDDDYSETLGEHFASPRIAPMWDDYDPVDGGTISWKELSDRVVVTFDEVREYNTTNMVSFQVEMVSDGTIIFSYLDVQVSDGLVGLSRGEGLDENFYESDMSGYGNCGPQPPKAVSKTVEFAFDTPNAITLDATDDGLPEPASLTYIIVSLPSQGELSEGGTVIDSVPFTLSGNEVVFTPETGNYNSTSFQFKANDGGIPEEDGGDSNIAVISIDIVEPTPPTCQGHSYAIAANGSQDVVLVADDDGNPVPPGALTYIITELPENGYLKYADMPVGSVPFEMSDNFLTYYPHSGYQGLDSFSFKVNDGGEAPYGGDSNTSTIDITIGGTQVIFDFPMDTDPGWSTTGDWAFGQPTGGGTHNGDPSSGYTGSNVYGYNLAGDYASNMGTETLTTTTMDFSGVSGATLQFQRWLGVESSQFDHAKLELYNGSWHVLWDHDGSSISDNSWNLMDYDISALADGYSNVRLRWTMGITDGGVTYPGWNIDDVQISGLLSLADNDAPVIEAGSWKSLADHGEAGELAIQLADTGRTCEPRWLSTYKLQLMFSEPVVVPTGAVIATGLENGPFTGEATLDATGLVLTVVFEGANQLVERDIYTIEVADSVTDLAGNALTGDRSVELVVLTGNLTDNAGANKINAFDKSLIIARLGQTVEQAGVEFDIACTGRSAGVIDAFDKSLLISRLGSEIEE